MYTRSRPYVGVAEKDGMPAAADKGEVANEVHIWRSGEYREDGPIYSEDEGVEDRLEDFVGERVDRHGN